MKNIGKVFLLEFYNPTCECGKVVSTPSKYTFDKVLGGEDGKEKQGDHVALSFCECGNVFIAWKPQINNNHEKEKSN